MAKGKITLQPANKKAIWGYIIASLVFLGLGILSFVLIYMAYPGDINAALVAIILAFGVGASVAASYWWIILIVVLGLILLGFLVGWLLLVLVAKLGHVLVYAGTAITILSGLIMGVVALLIPGLGLAIALSSFIPAGALLFAVVFQFNKIKRAGEFLKFAGQVVLAEKGMIISPLFVSGITVVNFLTMASIFAGLVLVFPAVPYVGYILGSLASLFQLIIYYGAFYAAEAINTTYAYEWYRRRDPDMKFCLKNVAGMFGPIVTFGIVTALISWLQQMLRNAAASAQSKGNIAGIVLAVLARMIASLIGFVYKYLTYFTLPAIAIEGLGFKDGVKRSMNLLKRYYMDVLIRETGVSGALSIVQFMSFLIYGVVGAIIGFIVYGASWEILIILLPILIFGYFPTFFIMRPMKTGYLTFVFAYAQDEESGFKLPTRMPADLRGDMKEARKTLNKDKSIAAIIDR
ncbi:MAG: DUF6159 family protein [Candidatus Heimdallarchaeota archaeon]